MRERERGGHSPAHAFPFVDTSSRCMLNSVSLACYLQCTGLSVPNCFPCLSVPVFRLDVICHSLGFLVAMVWVMWVIRGADILHLVDAATLITALIRSMTRYLESESVWH